MRHLPSPVVLRLTTSTLALLALMVSWSPNAFADLTIGSPNVAIADPQIPTPATTPCVVTLLEHQAFADFDDKPYAYAPPTDCPGPWEKVVLSADFSVTAGRQFDRTAQLWLGRAIIYFGTTQEPSATVSPSWRIERDVTDYSELFTAAHAGHATLGNFVGTDSGITYDGIIYGSFTLSFYPLVDTVPDHPARADLILPLSGNGSDGGAVDLASPDATFSVTFTALPRNIERAFLDVYMQSQAADEFWFFNLPDNLAAPFGDGNGTAFREGQISVDGQPAGVAPIFPWIYTGGADPLLWRPIPGVQTLSFAPYRVDLTPFAGTLVDGKPHSITMSVFNSQDHFTTTGNLLLYVDHGSAQVSGSVTTNTLNAVPTPVVTENIGNTGAVYGGSVTVTSTRQFTIAGTLTTSHGTVTTQLDQAIAFSNVQQLGETGVTYYLQDAQQNTTIDATTTRKAGATTTVLHEQRAYPLTLNFRDAIGSDGTEILATSADQEFKRQVSIGVQGFGTRSASIDNHMVTSATRHYDQTGNLAGIQSDAKQTYSYKAPFGACYSRQIMASRNTVTNPAALTGVVDGVGCPGSANTLYGFDAFYNYASSLFGASLQLLP